MEQEIYTKYNFTLPYSSLEKNINRLTNQLWKLIPMRENNENWEKQLNTVILDVVGLNEVLNKNPLFLQALSKMEGLKNSPDLDFQFYRKTVFECISLIQEMKQHGN